MTKVTSVIKRFTQHVASVASVLCVAIRVAIRITCYVFSELRKLMREIWDASAPETEFYDPVTRDKR